MGDIPILTPRGFALMELSVEKECAGLGYDVGISVALWRLQELMKGYRHALDSGYLPHGYEVQTKDERETQP